MVATTAVLTEILPETIGGCLDEVVEKAKESQAKRIQVEFSKENRHTLPESNLKFSAYSVAYLVHGGNNNFKTRKELIAEVPFQGGYLKNPPPQQLLEPENGWILYTKSNPEYDLLLQLFLRADLLEKSLPGIKITVIYKTIISKDNSVCRTIYDYENEEMKRFKDQTIAEAKDKIIFTGRMYT